MNKRVRGTYTVRRLGRNQQRKEERTAETPDTVPQESRTTVQVHPFS